MLAALQTELDALADDTSVRCVVLAAAGRAYCAGHDLKEMRAEPSLGYYRELFTRCGKVMLSIQRLPVPVIARVHGVATAAGCQLVATCDLAVSVNTARFAVSGVNLGLFCATPSVALSRNVGARRRSRCSSPASSCRRTKPVPAAWSTAWWRPRRWMRRSSGWWPASSPSRVQRSRWARRCSNRQLEMGVEAAYQTAVQTMACNMMDDSALEGVQAFIDKRPPNW